VFDEGTLPVFIRVRDPIQRCYVPIRPTICVVVDVASQLVMGYWIGNPLARGAQAHMDSLEMTEALLSAIIPTLASPECREYVGFLPERVGCDNIATHNPVMTALERVGIVTTKHGPYAPWSHGPRETVVGILKAMCEPLLGFDGRFVVADTLTEDPIKTRKALSGTQYRDTPRANITTEQLLDIMAFRKAFQDVVQRYNREFEHSRWKETRESRYYEFRRTEALRPWTDAMGMLETTRVTVREHIAVRQVDFATQSTAGHRFAFGESVTLRVDPMLRACFVPGATPKEWGALLPAKEFAKHQAPGEVVREQHRAAQAASDAARAARDALQLESLGSEEAVVVANAAAALAAKTKRKNAKPQSSDPAAAKRASKQRTETDPLRAPLPPVDAPPALFPDEILTARTAAPSPPPLVPQPVAPPVIPPRMSVIPGNPDAPSGPRPTAPAPSPRGTPARGAPMRGLPTRGSTVALLVRRPAPPVPTDSQETSA
jgi:hypothetical protein